jgi:bifunctional N-acetylglucosamine-1-phosphate-uridyltransferase/glucosamine-1-phosphate-acetyltransferase GlmU-like protein
MKEWGAVVVANPGDEGGGMLSRLPTLLHPVAGRPLVWHTVQALQQMRQPPETVLVLSAVDLSADLFGDIPLDLQVASLDLSAEALADRLGSLPESLLLVQAQAPVESWALDDLLAGREGNWLAPTDGPVAAALLSPSSVAEVLRNPAPFSTHHGWAAAGAKLADHGGVHCVRTRADLSRVHRRVRDRLVHALMEGGVTFIIPESTVVDVDVRIGRDTLVYPGVILEGQTTIGEETVVGPGCRIIDSWIGSGVELKGWNYISHTSVRNRAILEPHVRRGFD